MMNFRIFPFRPQSGSSVESARSLGGFAPFFVLLLFMNLGFWIYSNTFFSRFQFDDEMFIVQSPAIRHVFDWPAIFHAYNTRFILGLSFALNYAGGGLEEFGYHLVNFLIHWGNTTLLYFLLLHLARTPGARAKLAGISTQKWALFSALIFLTHPLQTQAVSYISQRAASLATLFYLAVLIFYLKYRASGRFLYYGAALFMAFLGILTKENVFTLPLILGVIELLFFPVDSGSWKKRLLYLAPFVLVVLIFPFLLLIDRPNSIISLKSQLAVPRFDIRLLWTRIDVFATYWRLFLFPVQQNVDYDYPLSSTFWSLRTMGSSLLMAGLLAWAGWESRRRTIITWGVLWVFITTLMECVAVIWTGADIIYEHWLYLPMVGFATLAGWGFCVLSAKCRYGNILFYLVIVILSLMTYTRNQVWQNPFTLWQDVIEKSPRKSRGYDNLASAYIAVGNYEAAYAYIRQAIALGPAPASWKTHNNLGLVYLETGRFEGALIEFTSALKGNPNSSQVLTNMGVVYIRQNELKNAREVFLKALQIEPLLVEPRLNLALIAKRQGQKQEALSWYTEAWKRDPHEERALFALAELSLNNADTISALKYAKIYLREGKRPDRLTQLGSLFADKNFRNLARALLEQAIARDPSYLEAYLELGKVYGNADDFVQAMIIWQKGARLAPGDPRFSALIRQAEALIQGRSQPQ